MEFQPRPANGSPSRDGEEAEQLERSKVLAMERKAREDAVRTRLAASRNPERAREIVKKTKEAAIVMIRELMAGVREEVGNEGVVDILGDLTEDVEIFLKSERDRWMLLDLGIHVGHKCGTCKQLLSPVTLACECPLIRPYFPRFRRKVKVEAEPEAVPETGAVPEPEAVQEAEAVPVSKRKVKRKEKKSGRSKLKDHKRCKVEPIEELEEGEIPEAVEGPEAEPEAAAGMKTS